MLAPPAVAAEFAARIEDLGQGGFVNVDCAACHPVALVTAEALLRGGREPCGEGSRPQRAAAVPRVRQEGAAVVSTNGGGAGREGMRSWFSVSLFRSLMTLPFGK